MKRFFFFGLLVSLACGVMAGNQAKTRIGSLNITKVVNPALMDIVPNTLQYVDATGNQAINASERGKLVFRVYNQGTGNGLGCVVRVTAKGSTAGITVQNNHPLPAISANDVLAVELSITSNMHTVDGQIELTVQVEEPNGYSSIPQTITIDTRAY